MGKLVRELFFAQNGKLLMQNENQPSSNGPERRRIRHLWQGSILLLLFPTFPSDWATGYSPENDEPESAAVALPNAHAHNDYLHDKPLLDALSQGFVSVEADVHLVGGELYLGHWLPQLFPARTLRETYLEPLHGLITRQGGRVYPGYNGTFFLMVDVKTDASATYTELRRQLLQYPGFQCNPYFRVFISGNRAIPKILNDPEEVMVVDGRLPDLYTPIASDLMPVISDNFRKHFRWRGKGSMSGREKEKLKGYAEEAHRQGKKLRFWATPDVPDVWATLLDAGVDFISIDDLKGAGVFFATRTNGRVKQAGQDSTAISRDRLVEPAANLASKAR